MTISDEPQFDIAVHYDYRAEQVIAALRGELDILTADDARRTLEAAVSGHTTLVLDLDDLVFCGAAGLHVIADLSQQLADLGGGLTVRSPSPAVTRMLGYLGLEGLVAVDGDRRTDVAYAAATDA